MLYAWDPTATATVIEALGDEHWRPREMALKVIAKRLIDDDLEAVTRRHDDSAPRVRAAASRALQRLGTKLLVGRRQVTACGSVIGSSARVVYGVLRDRKVREDHVVSP